MRCSAIAHSPIFAESWNVAWRKRPVGSILADEETPFSVIKNSFRYWAADPFVYEYRGEVFVFAELYDYVLRRGVIGYCKINGIKQEKWTVVITEKYHMSYPCIMEYNGKFYMMPETSAGEELVLYEAEDFPKKWKKVSVIRRNVRFADTTPIEGEEAGWALTFQIGNSPCLKLVNLIDGTREYLIDNENHLKIRPAGKMFKQRGRYIRPAQNSLDYGAGYGRSLIFYEYHLGQNGLYWEKRIAEVKPEALSFSSNIMIDGMHTYNATDEYEVIDVKTRRFNLLNFICRIVGKFQSILS